MDLAHHKIIKNGETGLMNLRKSTLIKNDSMIVDDREHNYSLRRSVNLNHVDKLRGFAALSVLVYHVIEFTNWSTFPVDGLAKWWRIG